MPVEKTTGRKATKATGTRQKTTANDNEKTTGTEAQNEDEKDTRLSVRDWRIEIFRQKSAKGGYRLYWQWRLTMENGSRLAKYGGTISTLPFPDRLEQYFYNSEQLAQKESK